MLMEKNKEISIGFAYIVIGLILCLSTIALDEKFGFGISMGVYRLWLKTLAFIVGGLLVFKGREKMGLKNKYSWRDKDGPQ